MKKTFLKNKKNVQFLIIGLGLIGGSIAKRLSKNGFEVLALDSSKSTLNHAKNTKAYSRTRKKYKTRLQNTQQNKQTNFKTRKKYKRLVQNTQKIQKSWVIKIQNIKNKTEKNQNEH